MGGILMSTRTMITYSEAIYNATVNTTCGGLFVNEAVDLLVEKLRLAESVFLVGNGGSLAACDHMANDLCLAGVSSVSLSNPGNISCIANDFGFDKIFSKQLEWQMKSQQRNVLVAFSCSGKSANVLEAVRYARENHAYIVTFSGFNPDNPLAAAGNLNFFVPSTSYGVVQIAHEALIHCAIDKLAGLY